MSVAAVTLLESAYPIGVTAVFLDASGPRGRHAADGPCHEGEQRRPNKTELRDQAVEAVASRINPHLLAGAAKRFGIFL